MKRDTKIQITEEIDFDGRVRIIEIRGFELKPYWKRLILVLCWWKNPVIILTDPKIIIKDKRECLFG